MNKCKRTKSQDHCKKFTWHHDTTISIACQCGAECSELHYSYAQASDCWDLHLEKLKYEQMQES